MAFQPTITVPYNGLSYSTNSDQVTISGEANSGTSYVNVNGSNENVVFTPGSGSTPAKWSYATTLSVGVNTFNITAIDTFNTTSTAAVLTITLTTDQILSGLVSPPTRPKVERFIDKLRLSIVKNPEDTIVGYNFYHSFFPGGGVDGYTKLNSSPVSIIAYTTTESEELASSVTMSGNLKTTTVVEQVTDLSFYTYDFTKTMQSTVSANVPPGEVDPRTSNATSITNYFVMTAVGFDSTNKVEFESNYSEEVFGSLLILNSQITSLVPRRRDTIAKAMANSVFSDYPDADINPGTVPRDIFIDPPSEQLEDLFVLQDFSHTAESFLTLLAFDDANGDGESDTVETDDKKSRLRDALGLNNDQNGNSLTQAFIDEAFDKLAANVNVPRGPAEYATGEVIFFIPSTSKLPSTSFTIPINTVVSTKATETTQAVKFKTISTVTVDINDIQSFLNTETGCYEFAANIRADKTGAASNVAAKTITSIGSGPSVGGLQVKNTIATDNGTDKESNKRLAERAMLAFTSVDAGTENGYLATTLAVTGVKRARIIRAGEPLMQRDFLQYSLPSDPTTILRHLGGKVDIYVQGENLVQLTDRFSFSYPKVTELVAITALSLQFQLTNTDVSEFSPVFEVYRVTNLTKGRSYDLTNSVVSPNSTDPTGTPADPTILESALAGDGDIIILDGNRPINIDIGLSQSDIVEIEYKYRKRPEFVLRTQPVFFQSSLESGFDPWIGQPTVEEQLGITVVGELSGPLVPGVNFYLRKLDDPLLNGNSTISKDAIILRYDDSNKLPIANTQTVTDEPHILFRGTSEPLDRYGAITSSIVVTNTQKTVTFISGKDYTVSSSGNTTSITISTSGGIANGSSVLISYQAGENFIITYTTNNLLNQVASRVEVQRHVTADVIVKDAVKNSVDIEMVVVTKPNVVRSELDGRIRTQISRFLNQKVIGEPVYQSDIIDLVKQVSGVSYIVIPLRTMVKSDGSYIVRDPFNITDFSLPTQYNGGLVKAYLTNISPLSYNTGINGGPTNYDGGNIPVLHSGIFEDDLPLTLVDRPEYVRNKEGSAYIFDGGKVLLSTRTGDRPSSHIYTATYFVKNDKERVLQKTGGITGAEDILVNSLEYLTLGKLVIIFDTISISKGA